MHSLVDSCMCPDQESNLATFPHPEDTLTSWTARPGLWSPFLMLTWPISPVSVPTLMGAPEPVRLLTPRPAPFLPHQDAHALSGTSALSCPGAAESLQGQCSEAADGPKKGREAHNGKPVSRASGHQPWGVHASCGKTYSSAGSFPQSTMENNTTFMYQQRREFHRLFI